MSTCQRAQHSGVTRRVDARCFKFLKFELEVLIEPVLPPPYLKLFPFSVIFDGQLEIVILVGIPTAVCTGQPTPSTEISQLRQQNVA